MMILLKSRAISPGFGSVVEKRYGEAQKDEVLTWVNLRYSHWTGNYLGMGYKDADSKRP